MADKIGMSIDNGGSVIMSIITITNDTDSNLVLAGRIIPVGESRQFDETVVPPPYRPKNDTPVIPKPVHQQGSERMAQLQTESVAVIKQALVTLEEEQLAALYCLEESAGKPRITLLSKIQDEMTRRASEGESDGL